MCATESLPDGVRAVVAAGAGRMRSIVAMASLVLMATLAMPACGDEEAQPPRGGNATNRPDVGSTSDATIADAAVDSGSAMDVTQPFDTGGDLDAADADVEADGGFDAEVGADADASNVTDGGRPRGTVRLANYIGCDDDSECPTGTGNCLTSIPFNRTWATSPARITIAELAPDWPRAGICSRACSDQVDACDGLQLPGAPGAAYTCQVIATGTPPYALVDGALPDPASLDPDQQTLGLPFAAVCLPPFRVTTGFGPDFCEPCNATTACEQGSACWLNQPFASDDDGEGVCLTPCDVDGSACPIGFACQPLDEQRGTTLGDPVEGTFCVPLQQTCGACRDADGDGFGTGLCDGNRATPHDCDDAVDYTWFDATDMQHAFPLICGESVDANCNGVGDVLEQVGTEVFGATHCTTCEDACEGAVPNGVRVCMGGVLAPMCGLRCTDPEAFVDCDGDPVNGCETAIDDPQRVFYADCDGDGVPRDVFRFDCAASGAVSIVVDGESCVGIPASEMGLAGPDGLLGFDCDDDDPLNTPGGAEVCDGQDNDCNTVADDTPLLTSGNLDCNAPGVLGECAANGTWACDLASGGRDEVCVPARPRAESCDGLDNDCNGDIDDNANDGGDAFAGAACAVTGISPATPIDDATNLCLGGILSCTEGGYVCNGYVAPAAVTCTNTCATASDGRCDDGGFASDSNTCATGTDCADCGSRRFVDWPGDNVDANCDGFDGDLSGAVFVRRLGSDTSGTGAYNSAFRTIERAIDDVTARRNGASPVTQLILASDETWVLNRGPLEIDAPTGFGTSHRNGAQFGIFGGYSFASTGARWTRGTGRSRVQFPTGMCAWDWNCLRRDSLGNFLRNVRDDDYLPMVDVKNPMDVRLGQVTVDVQAQARVLRDANYFDDNLIGLGCDCVTVSVAGVTTQTCDWCGNIALDDTEIRMANGASGTSGVDGVEGRNGLDALQPPYANRSTAGTLPTPTQLFCGLQSLPGNMVQGYTTQGGKGGTHYVPPASSNCNSATVGYLAGDGANTPDLGLTWRTDLFAANGGTGGLGAYAKARAAGAGRAGQHANQGLAAAERGTSASPFIIGDGGNGRLGFPGGGGGGGGGGITYLCNGTGFDGNHGTGGASGGCGGVGGTRGTGGRSVVGVLASGTAFPKVVGTLTLDLAGGGAGGTGGRGGTGGLGGMSAPGVNPQNGRTSNPFSTSINPGAGGQGGDGGTGGGGGGGGGGWCVAVMRPQLAPIPEERIDFGASCQSGGPGGAGGQGGVALGSGRVGPAGFSGQAGQGWLVYPQ